MSSLGVSALTTSAISAVKTLSRKRAYIQDYTTNHTLITVDASIREVHKLEAPPTQFPIESGQLITDNFIIKPFELNMEGLISDDPVSTISSVVTSAISSFVPPTGVIAGGAAVAVFNALSGTKSPSVANFNQFLKIIINKRPLNVYTTLYFYKSMWMSELKVDRDSKMGSALAFNARFVQIIIVQPQAVNTAKYQSPSLSTPQANLGGTTTAASKVNEAAFTNGKLSGFSLGTGGSFGPVQ